MLETSTDYGGSSFSPDAGISGQGYRERWDSSSSVVGFR